MRVLQINAVNGIRSTGRSTLETAEYLNAKGYESFIVYSDGIPYKNGMQIGSFIERKIHALFSRFFGLQGYFSKIGTKKLIKYLKKVKPDVVHLRNLHSNYINLKILFNYLSIYDIPTVITLHDCWFYTGKCTHYTMDKCYKWQNECFKCPRLSKDNPSWFFDRTNKMFHDKKRLLQSIPRLAVIGVSNWITNEAKKSFLSSAKIITCIYNWVDAEVFKPVEVYSLINKLNVNNKFVILGVSSSWNNAKGLDKFIELSKSIPNNYVIILVGSLRGTIELPKNIINVPETNDIKELVTYYSLADVFINLSQEETFGKVTAEALSCGTPAIVLNSTANPELIGKNCGFILETFDLSIINKYIEKIKKIGKEYYSSFCRDFVKNKINKNNKLDEYIAVYEKIIKKDDGN